MGLQGGQAAPTQVDFFGKNQPERLKYRVHEVIGKGSYGLVASATDLETNQKVAIKKICNVFDHVSDATRILREIKLLRLLRHPDIVEVKHILLPPDEKRYIDIFVVFELMETDLHQVIKANDDLSHDHHQFFLYQLLRGLKFVHSARVFHRDLKPKNILANSDCKLKICDFGLARPDLDAGEHTTVHWTDYVATRWYRAPELCGSFFARYSPAIDIWSVGCIFAEILLGKPLFPGRNVVQQLELITDLLGKPEPEVIAKVRNEKAKNFLTKLRPKQGVPFEHHFRGADPKALALLQRMLSFDPQRRPSATDALKDPYFEGLANEQREPSATPISDRAFVFERRKLDIKDVRRLIYEEILEFHPLRRDEYRALRAAEEEAAAAAAQRAAAVTMQMSSGAMLRHPGAGPPQRAYAYSEHQEAPFVSGARYQPYEPAVAAGQGHTMYDSHGRARSALPSQHAGPSQGPPQVQSAPSHAPLHRYQPAGVSSAVDGMRNLHLSQPAGAPSSYSAYQHAMR